MSVSKKRGFFGVVAEPLCKVPMGSILRESWVFLGAWTLATLVLTFVPSISMWLVWQWR